MSTKISYEVIRNFEYRLNARGFATRTIDPHKIDIERSWVPGEGGFHNHTLSSLGDRTDSWKIQWMTLERWRERIKSIGKLNDSNIDDAIDFLHAFTIVCFHLKDYVEVSLNQKLDSENCELFWFPEFLICRDIANGLKHLSLSKPSVASNVAFHREYDHFAEEQLIKVSIYLGDTLYDYTHIDFVKRCRSIWLEYLFFKGLVSSIG